MILRLLSLGQRSQILQRCIDLTLGRSLSPDCQTTCTRSVPRLDVKSSGCCPAIAALRMGSNGVSCGEFLRAASRQSDRRLSSATLPDNSPSASPLATEGAPVSSQTCISGRPITRLYWMRSPRHSAAGQYAGESRSARSKTKRSVPLVWCSRRTVAFR